MFTCLWIKILPRFMLWWCYICQSGRPTLLKILRSVRFGFYSYCRKTYSSNVLNELLITFERNNKERSFVFILSTSFMKMSELVLGPIPQTDFVNPVFKHAHFFRNRKCWKITVLHDLILKNAKKHVFNHYSVNQYFN